MIKGVVKRGKGDGKLLGFPTANIPNTGVGLDGIFAGFAIIKGVEYPAAIFAPKDSDLEAYVIGFDQDIYGNEILVEIISKIRDIVPYKSHGQMKELIEKDVEATKNVYRDYKKTIKNQENF